MSGSLFADDGPDQARRLAPALSGLAARGAYFGTSSWKYEGWLGSIYSRDRYFTRGRFSRKKFEAECIREYAETFPTVGGDFSFYQFPTAEFWNALFARTPPGFTFGLKAPEGVTVWKWPAHARYGPRAGSPNEHFLDPDLFAREFFRPLEPHRGRIAAVMFEFGQFARTELMLAEFLPRLLRFLDALPKGWPYAVELRNAEFLQPNYFAALMNLNVAHVFNAWTRMPTLAEQVAMGESFTADFTVTRALLKKGRAYEAAVKLFEPYRETQEPDESSREALAEIARRAMRTKRKAYAYVNNRLEGNAPSTIEAVAAALEVHPPG
jgi:uncharacterized protein YecE (DUF72 family)